MANREKIRVFDGHCLMQEEGYTDPEPILHVYGRDENRMRRHVTIEGFHPYLLAPLNEVQQRAEALANDHRVRRIEWTEDDDGPIEDIDGRRLAKIVTINPYDVPKIRENFSYHAEADVRFFERFTIDCDIRDTMSIPVDADEPIDVSLVESSDDDPLDVPPRIGYMDIEVEQTDDGPSVVSDRGTELAENPITAITSYDNYTRSYHVYVLAHDEWSDEDRESVESYWREATNVFVYDEEKRLLADYISHVADFDFDVLTAWNGQGFDFPYLVNRLHTLSHPDRRKLSPVGIVDEMRGDGSWMNDDWKGRILFDLLDGFKKTRFRQSESYSLEYIANEVTDIEKLDIGDIDDAWRDEPEIFVEYSTRDVEALVAIDEAQGVLV